MEDWECRGWLVRIRRSLWKIGAGSLEYRARVTAVRSRPGKDLPMTTLPLIATPPETPLIGGVFPPRFEIDFERQICSVALPRSTPSCHALWGVTVCVGLEDPVEVEDAHGTLRSHVVIAP